MINLIELKPQILQSLGPDNTVFEAAETMANKRIGSVIILDGQKLVGIFTERDVLTRVVAANLKPKSTLVRAVMTSCFHSITDRAVLP